MGKIRLGGIKILEGHSHLISSSRTGENALSGICARLAASGINLTFLTHTLNPAGREATTAVCTDSTVGFSGYFLLKLDHHAGLDVRLQRDVTIASVFPHGRKPHVAGELIEVLAKAGIRPQGIASSSSTVSSIIASADVEKTIDLLFDPFEFPTYQSPFDWHAAYRGKEQVLREIICSYDEEIIKVYGVTQLQELDLWQATIAFSQLARFGHALTALHEHGVSVPFLIGQSGPDMSLLFAFCSPLACSDQVRSVLGLHLPAVDFHYGETAAILFLHGPHFGDRPGIANALVQALEQAGVSPLAVSCTVSSISVVIREDDLERARQGLESRFREVEMGI